MALPKDFDKALWITPMGFYGLIGAVLADDKAQYANLFRDDGFAKPFADLIKDRDIRRLLLNRPGDFRLTEEQVAMMRDFERDAPKAPALMNRLWAKVRATIYG